MSTERLEQLFSFLKSEPNDPFLIYAIATEYNSKNEVEEALKYYGILINEHPNYVGTYYHLGKLQQKLNQLDLAITTFEKGIQVAQNARNMHAMSELKGALAELKEDDEDW